MLSLTTLPHRALATTLTPVQVTTMAKLSIVALVMPSNWEIILLAQVMIVTLFKCQLGVAACYWGAECMLEVWAVWAYWG